MSNLSLLQKIIRMASTKNIKYQVSCEIHKLKINKNIEFETKVIWKRHQNKAQTTTVRHAHGYSIFNQPLSLEFNLTFNTDTMLFQPKNTELVAIIEYQGKVKSGGYVKYNISDNLNTNPHGSSLVTIPLTQCPDPNAFIEATFSYERLSDQVDADDMSVLNASSRDLNLSRVDFHDDKLSLQMERINQAIKKFENLNNQIKKKGKDSGNKMPELKTKLQVIQGQKKAMQNQITKLQKQLAQKQQTFKEQRKKSKKQSDELVKQLQKKNKQIKDSKSLNVTRDDKSDYKQLYENALRELQEMRSNDMRMKNSIDIKFGNQLQDVKQVADFSNVKSPREDEQGNIQELSRQNVELQSKVASMSHKLAQLFNASYQYGGAKLLDFLQTSIGLTQLE